MGLEFIIVYEKIIKDPIYGYIKVTKLELRLLNEINEFERLKNIKQLGMANHVYPTAVHTRYEHSLGTMHVAGLMISSILKKRGLNQTINDLFTELGNLFNFIGNLTHPITKIQLTNISTSNIEALEKDEKIIQFVRVLALLHDIGHLSLSHTFEFGFNAFRRETQSSKFETKLNEKVDNFLKDENLFDLFIDPEIKKRPEFSQEHDLHEKVGHHLIKSQKHGILNILEDEFGSGIALIINTIFELPDDAYDFLTIVDNSSSNKEEIIDGSEIKNLNKSEIIGTINNYRYVRFWYPFFLLKEFVSGSLDADRLDYVARDINRSGITVGLFDIERIIANLTISRSNDQSLYRLSVSMKGISGVESFYLQRYFCYRWLYGHHLVRLLDRLVEFALHIYLEYDKKDEMIKRVIGLDLFNDKKNSKLFDDNYLIDALSSMRHVDLSITSDKPFIKRHAFISNLPSLLDSIIFRRNMPIPLWKSWFDFKLSFMSFLIKDESRKSLLEKVDTEFINVLYSILSFDPVKSMNSKSMVDGMLDVILVKEIYNRIDKLFTKDPLWLWNDVIQIVEGETEKLNSEIQDDIKFVNAYYIERKVKKYSKLDILIFDEIRQKSVDLAEVSPVVSSLINPYYDDPPFYIYIQFKTVEQRKIIKTKFETKRLDDLKMQICESIFKKLFETTNK